jgi:hypothetical protein
VFLNVLIYDVVKQSIAEYRLVPDAQFALGTFIHEEQVLAQTTLAKQVVADGFSGAAQVLVAQEAGEGESCDICWVDLIHIKSSLFEVFLKSEVPLHL